MKTPFPRKKESEFENESHISRKKKALSRQVTQKNIKDKHNAYHLEPEDIETYERYLK